MMAPCHKYQDHLREAIKGSAKTQKQIALDAGLEPSNLSNLLAGRRKPLLNPAKNLALASACGQTPEFASRIQLAAEACHGMHNQPPEFRRYMGLTVRSLEALMQQMTAKLPSLQSGNGNGILLAAKKMVASLKYWWPAEACDSWDDYQIVGDEFRDDQRQLPPGQQFDTLVQVEMEEALEWARDIGEVDPEIEKLELTRKLANALGIELDAFQQIIGGLEAARG